MNKRSILFFIALSLSIYLTSYWFGPKPKQAVKAETPTEQVQQQLLAEVSERTATLSNLPIAELLYSTETGDYIFYSYAIQARDQYLLLSPTNEPIEKVYIKTSLGESPYQELSLRITAKEKNKPVLYSANPEELLTSARIPSGENVDLQLISFPIDEDVEITLAETENQNVYFPISPAKNDSIALARTKEGYRPYGVYTASSNSLRPLSDFSGFDAILSYEAPLSPTFVVEQNERFFVLENDYQQIVFSNIGGAVSEINLPLQDKEHPKSVIRPITADRILEKDYPSNDHFPSFPYQIANDDGKVIDINDPAVGGYYPLLRRSVIGAGQKQPTYRLPPRYYAFNIISTDPGSANQIYQLKRLEKNLIEFEALYPNRRIIKTYSFPQDTDNAPYILDVQIKVEGDGRGLFLTSGLPEVELISGNFSPTLKYRTSRGTKSNVEKIGLPKDSISSSSVYPDWVCNSNGFLGLIIDPLSEIGAGYSASHISGSIAPTRLSLIDKQHDRFPPSKYPAYELQLPLNNANKNISLRYFAGPFENDTLKLIDATYANPATGYNPDYIACQSFHGWFSFISEPFAKFLFSLMKLFYKITHSWGFSIILLTIALRVMMYPLNAWSIRSSMKMQELSPKISAIQARHKNDPKRAQLEIMNLYREGGANPLMGCLPILIQLPFLIGMFDLLKSTFELRGASFIPGWINNLTAPDVLFSWGTPIPFFGNEFHLLPVLLGVTMYFQQKMSSKLPKDKSQWTDQQKQQKLMGSLMTVVFTVMFYHFPSGLNIYWLSSMLLGILQQWWMTKRYKNKKDKGSKIVKLNTK